MIPVRKHPPNALHLDGKGMPSTALFLPTTPRERPGKGDGCRLYSSDTTSDRIRQVNRLHTSHSTRQESGHRKNSEPAEVPFHAMRELRAMGAPVGAVVPAVLAPLTRRLPSATAQGGLRGGTLPPIGAEGMDSGFTSTVTEEEELDIVFGREEEWEGERQRMASDTNSDTGDEVSDRPLRYRKFPGFKAP